MKFIDLNRTCFFMSLISEDLFEKIEGFRINRNKAIHEDPYETFTVKLAKETISKGVKILE